MIIKNTFPLPSPKQNFKVPVAGVDTLLAPVESLALSALFGTGIAAAELNQLTQKSIQGFNNDPKFQIRTDLVVPDANPDGKGGYTKTIGWAGYMSSSLVGMPVMCRLRFIGTTYTALDGSSVTIPDIIFETVVITLRMGKQIEKTAITGRNTGSVKEYIGQNDWTIEIRAIVTASQPVNDTITSYNQDGKYPYENMEAIQTLIEAPIALQVECWYLNKRGINFIVIDDGVDISQVAGEYEMQRIVLPCLSDNPLIITVASP